MYYINERWGIAFNERGVLDRDTLKEVCRLTPREHLFLMFCDRWNGRWSMARQEANPLVVQRWLRRHGTTEPLWMMVKDRLLDRIEQELDLEIRQRGLLAVVDRIAEEHWERSRSPLELI